MDDRPLDREVTLANWLEAPWNRSSFQHVREVLPTARVRRGPTTRRLPEAPLNLDGLELERRDGATTTLRDHLEDTCADGICVVHRGVIAYERYLNSMEPDTLHLLMSVSKSFVGAILGQAINRGRIGLHDRVDAIAPAYAGTALGDATPRQLIDMTAGVDFTEDYAREQRRVDERGEPVLPVAWARGKELRYEQHGGIVPHAPGPPAGVREYARGLGLRHPHGAHFEYRSAFTNVVADLLEASSGLRYPELLARELWIPLGQEYEADIGLDRVGFPVVEGGMSCSLRDLARFGLLYARGGRVGDTEIVPGDWVDDTFDGDAACRAAYLAGPHAEQQPSVMYRNAFWVTRPGAAIVGLGIHGQFCLVDRERDLVIARLSSYGPALPLDVSDEVFRSFDAIADALPD